MVKTKSDPPGQKSPQPELTPSEDKGGQIRKFGLLGIIVGELLIFSGAGVGIGYFLWAKCGTPWWVLLVCSSLGLGFAFYQLYLISLREL